MLCASIAIAYYLIAKDWEQRERAIEYVGAAKSLADLRNIFTYCMYSSYLFMVIKLFIAAWLPYIILLIILNFFAWRYYIWRRHDIQIVYTQMQTLESVRQELHLADNLDPIIQIQIIKDTLNKHFEVNNELDNI